MTAAAKLTVKDIVEARANSQTGATELDVVHADGTTILQFDKEAMLRLFGTVVKLQRMAPPTEGQQMEIRAFPVDWWTLGRTPDNREVVLSFEVKEGGHLGFRMDMAMAARLSETLRIALGEAAKG
jgi:hypothetical protein